MSTPFEQALRDELMVATRRNPRRGRRLPLVAAAVAAVTVVAVGVIITDQPAASADVEITRDGDHVLVRLTDFENTAEEIEAAIDAEGIDIQVEAVPSGPSQVGRFVGDVGTSGDVEDVERFEVDGVTFRAFSIPVDWDGTLTLFLGRRADDDESYQSAADAFAPGEPLACHHDRVLGDLVAPLEGYRATVLVFEAGQVLPAMTLTEAIAAGHGDDAVTGAAAVSPTEVVIDVGREVPPQDRAEC